ncbi:MAG TPA: DUF2284 domain-containing protein [Anaerovoracaceae bacterium]|nr:DUF2284 domain-containing protein [Anaerovoracaceae bacterium]
MKIETYEAGISTVDYIDKYVDIGGFLEMCKACDCYNNKWSCPPFDFSPREYWENYDNLYFLGKKIIFDDEEKENWKENLTAVKDQLTEELFAKEREFPGSVSLSAGNCEICGEDNCTKPQCQPCRYPDKMRYSIESLGGNVGLTASKLLGIELKWMTDGELPEYFVLVGGLLY